MTFTEVMEHVAQGFEAIGVGVLVLGMLWSLVLALRAWRASGGRTGFRALRESFGGVLLLGLEVLVAADLIRTVAVSPTVQNVAVLGLIVLIRTFLSFSLQIEIDGVPPWRRALTSGASTVAQAARTYSTAQQRPDSPGRSAGLAGRSAVCSGRWRGVNGRCERPGSPSTWRASARPPARSPTRNPSSCTCATYARYLRESEHSSRRRDRSRGRGADRRRSPSGEEACHELNGAFAALLATLGYDVTCWSPDARRARPGVPTTSMVLRRAHGSSMSASQS
jgi:uncharacterized membrane protein